MRAEGLGCLRWKGVAVEFVILYLLVNIAAGALACFMGKRLFYLMLGVIVFLGVFNIGLSATGGDPVALGVAAVLGLVAALLSKFAYKAGVFLVGFAAGAALGFLAGMLVPGAVVLLWAIMLAVGALVGLAALRWCDLFVRIGTAYTGATFLASNALAAVLAFPQLAACAVPGDALATFDELSTYIGGPFSEAFARPMLVATLVLAVVGVIVQGHTRVNE